MMEKGFGYKKCGIYKILNTINGKFYIGSSKNIYYRIRRHYSELKRNIHPNYHLQNSFNKHTEKVFIVDIIEECLESELTIREQWYIDTLHPSYNITLEVIRNTPSLETREKIRNTLLNHKKNGTLIYALHDNQWNPASIYDSNCNLLFKGKSRSEAGKYLLTLYPNLKHPSMTVANVARNGKIYKDHLIFNGNEPCHLCKKIDGNHQTKITVVDIINNTIISYPSVAEALRILNISKSGLYRAIKYKILFKKQYIITKDEN